MIYGTYYLSGASTAKSAFAIEEGKERIVVICSHSHRLLVDATPSEFTTGLNLPGQAVDVESRWQRIHTQQRDVSLATLDQKGSRWYLVLRQACHLFSPLSS